MSTARSKRIGLPPSARGRSLEAVFVAWSNDGARIVAKGSSFESAREAARAKGEPDPIVEQEPIKARWA